MAPTRLEAVAELARRRLASDPLLYARKVLGVAWTDDQIAIAESLMSHQRVMVCASHGVGKSNLGGGLVNWHYDCFSPGITLTTAPTARQVDEVLWKEVRRQRAGRPGLQPAASRMASAPDHFAVGLTAGKSDAFQGRHEEHMLIFFDEAVGVDSAFWDAAEGMMVGPARRWCVIMNPTDTTSRAYEEYCSGSWKVHHLSALTHPNILAELQGEDPPYPAAVRLSWVNDRVKGWCQPLGKAPSRDATDFEWPPGSGEWHRPGPLFESRVMGRWPSQSTSAVWGQAAWESCQVKQEQPEEPLVLGVDVARFGDDFTCVHARRGRCSVRHTSVNGLDTVEVAGLVVQTIGELAEEGEDPKFVLIAIDDDGVGGGVSDQLSRMGYRVMMVNSGAVPRRPDDYPNVRSEAWFVAAEAAGAGLIDVSRLQETDRHRLMTQLMAPTYSLDSAGRRVVEPKKDTKKRIKRSPDDADAFNLCHYARPDSGWTVHSL